MKQPPESEPNTSAQSRSSSLAVGAVTLLASSVFGQAMGLITIAVTARLLTPTDFGIIAYFLIVVALLEMFQREISVILIRITDATDEHLNTVFTLQILLGVIAGAFLWICTPLVDLLGLPELTELILPLCVIALVTSIRSTRFPLLERNLRFGFAAAEEAISRVTYTLFAIVLALIWRDFWAIVAANFLTQIARIIWSFYAAPMVPRLSLKCWRDCIGFSSWSMGAQIAQFLTLNMPQIIIGAVLGLADAGLFRIGYRFVSLFTIQAFGPLERVIYPGLANISRTDGTNQQAFEQANAILLGIIIPVSIGMVLISDHLIVVIAGYEWLAAAQVIWVLTPLKAVEILQANVRSASYVKGNTKRLFIRNSILLIITLAFMLLGSEFGFLSALIAAGASSLAAISMTLIMARDFGTGGFFKPIFMAWRTFVACGAMVVAVLIVNSAYGNVDAAGWAIKSVEDLPLLRIRFTVKVLTGIVVYIATHLLLWRLAGQPDGFESMALNLLSRIKSRCSASFRQKT